MKVYESAKKIVERLRSAGYVAYFAGGWVRDYIMGHPSSDIDIATNAQPEIILALFKRTIPVGINFGVVIVLQDKHQFEVSTFRKDFDYHDGRRPSKIALSTPEEDAERRDFTINGMFFDPLAEEVIDYVNGRADIEKKVIRTIGNPNERFREDRLRMLRAFRFAHRFNFEIALETRMAISEKAPTLFPAVAIERVWHELKKMADHAGFDKALVDMYKLGLLTVIFPKLQNTPLHQIRARVSSFAAFPKKVPPILFLMELFPDDPPKEQLGITLYLKASKHDQKIVEYVFLLRKCVEKEENCDLSILAKLYADPLFEMAIHVIAARLEEKNRVELLSKHASLQKKLASHIERICAKTPLITSYDLVKEGITPGKEMGRLLQEAEKLSINQDINSKSQVINLLKQSDVWPKAL